MYVLHHMTLSWLSHLMAARGMFSARCSDNSSNSAVLQKGQTLLRYEVNHAVNHAVDMYAEPTDESFVY
jgi:hypothetical protein